MPENKSKMYVTVQTLTTVLVIILAGMGWIFNNQSGLSKRVDEVNIESSNIQKQLAEIQTDVRWIKETIDKE